VAAGFSLPLLVGAALLARLFVAMLSVGTLLAFREYGSNDSDAMPGMRASTEKEQQRDIPERRKS
jgi:hypothetical protein